MANTNLDSGKYPTTTPHSAVQHKMWVVIADRQRARILSRSGRDFDAVKVLHADSGLDDGLNNDTIGRGGASGAGRHKYEPSMEESRQVELSLARDIATCLETALTRRDFAELAVAAPPQMLGEIRKSLPAAVLKALVAESDKNLMNMADRELRDELLSMMPGPERI